MLVRSDPESTDRAKFPEFFPAIAELTAAQDDNGIGSVDGPAHSRLLQPLADHRLAAAPATPEPTNITAEAISSSQYTST